ncbi:MAG: class I SAM-dependent methyltransferase [Deltaproteobacteria bacterium]|nr:class I SAM-dependent methyltransferase [Deltaproteobacteria bacterium]
MGFYEDRVLPHFIDLACGTGPICKQREKVVPMAEGRVLEIGMGSGHNIPYYDPAKTEMVWGLEPSEGMRLKAQKKLSAAPFEVEWLGLSGEEIPLDTASADTVLLTFTLCTIPDFRAALAQMHRVLKPGGRLVFCEHGAAPDAGVRRWQDRINPLWRRMAGGCNLNRPIPAALEEARFEIRSLETMYLPGSPRIAGFNYWGYAVHA